VGIRAASQRDRDIGPVALHHIRSMISDLLDKR
jgi:hypothetical protein